jgi:uncharacterized protein (TIGR02266 family)
MVTPKQNEHRSHLRYEVELEVGIYCESNFYVNLTENLSEGGLFIATHQIRPIGTVLEVSLTLPQHPSPIRAVATVRWIRVYSDTSDGAPGMGVQFDGMDPAHVNAIRAYLAARAPMFYDDE